MAETSLADVDIADLLYRLTRYAQGLFGAFKALGHEPADLAHPGGEGPEDLAMNLLLGFIDPSVKVKWNEEWGRPNTDKVLPYLKRALERDFLDLKKSKRYKTLVYVEDTPDGDGGFSLDKWAVVAETPEGLLLRKERVEEVIARFSDDPNAQGILRLQLDPDGYNAFTNQELASLLDTTVDDIENRKKRVHNRLLRMIKAQEKGAGTHAKALCGAHRRTGAETCPAPV